MMRLTLLMGTMIAFLATSPIAQELRYVVLKIQQMTLVADPTV